MGTEAAGFPETSVLVYQTTRCYEWNYGNLNIEFRTYTTVNSACWMEGNCASRYKKQWLKRELQCAASCVLKGKSSWAVVTPSRLSRFHSNILCTVQENHSYFPLEMSPSRLEARLLFHWISSVVKVKVRKKILDDLSQRERQRERDRQRGRSKTQ